MARLSSAVLAAAIAGLCLLQLVRALPYSASSPVVSLTESNFEAKIKNAGFCLVEVRPLQRRKASDPAPHHPTVTDTPVRCGPCSMHCASPHGFAADVCPMVSGGANWRVQHGGHRPPLQLTL